MSRKLAIEDCPESIVWDVVYKILSEDPDIRRLGTTIRAWQGEPEDLIEPTIAQLPFIRLSPAPDQTGWENIAQSKSFLKINIMIIVEGTCASDLLNFWSVVRAAIFPQQQAQYEQVLALTTAAQVIRFTISGLPFQPKLLGDNLDVLVGDGSITASILVNT